MATAAVAAADLIAVLLFMTTPATLGPLDGIRPYFQRIARYGGDVTLDVMSGLDDAIGQGWAAASREHPEPTIRYFADLLERHPGDARALLEYAGALDFAGQEAEAAPVYEQAFSAGLGGDELRQALIQYGSTLRNLSRFDEANATNGRSGTMPPN
jgi:tetratricopeptide (TPR) repeat protein